MKLLRMLFSSKPVKEPKPAKEKRPIGHVLLDKAADIGLKWLKSHWNAALWNQDK